MKNNRKEMYSYIHNLPKPKTKTIIINILKSTLTLGVFACGIFNNFSFFFMIISMSISIFSLGLITGNILNLIIFCLTVLFLNTKLSYSYLYTYSDTYIEVIPVFLFLFWSLACINMYQIQKYHFIRLNYKTMLEQKVAAEKKKTVKTSLDFVNSLMEAYILKSPGEKEHINNVANLCKDISKEMGLSKDFIEQVYWAGLFHDVGKIRFSDDFMSIKVKELSTEQFEYYKTHTVFGAELLEKLTLDNIAVGVKYHHERWNGSGYPEGLKGDDIPLVAQIVAVANKIDRIREETDMASVANETITQLEEKSGRNYSPIVVNAALSMLQNKK